MIQALSAAGRNARASHNTIMYIQPGHCIAQGTLLYADKPESMLYPASPLV